MCWVSFSSLFTQNNLIFTSEEEWKGLELDPNILSNFSDVKFVSRFGSFFICYDHVDFTFSSTFSTNLIKYHQKNKKFDIGT
jgi:hypothetical protein